MRATQHAVWAKAALVLLTAGLIGLSPVPPAFASSQYVKHLQETLHEKGYDPGPIDGHMGAQTRNAVSQYQKAQGLPETGQVDAATAEKLGIAKESEASARGSEATDFKAAAREVGKGGEGFGHEIVRGKPVAATKDLGEGMGKGGVKVGSGVKKAVNPKSDSGDPEQKH